MILIHKWFLSCPIVTVCTSGIRKHLNERIILLSTKFVTNRYLTSTFLLLNYPSKKDLIYYTKKRHPFKINVVRIQIRRPTINFNTIVSPEWHDGHERQPLSYLTLSKTTSPRHCWLRTVSVNAVREEKQYTFTPSFHNTFFIQFSRLNMLLITRRTNWTPFGKTRKKKIKSFTFIMDKIGSPS